MAIKQHSTHDEKETARLAAELAREAPFPGLVFLRGPLGSGKSVFARSFIRTLTGNPAEEVPSPTFTLVQTYDTPRGTIWHFDLYRLERPEDVYELGWEDALSEGLVLVEWPEKLGPRAPRPALDIHIAADQNKGDSRVIEIRTPL